VRLRKVEARGAKIAVMRFDPPDILEFVLLLCVLLGMRFL
jgi:hypothetical protein